MSRATPMQRIDAKTDRSGECWLWTSSLNRYGYAEMKINGRSRMAHRVAYELLVGPIPDGLQLDHLCRVRYCVNPAHLEPVTSAENTRRGESFAATNGSKTHCKRGHAFDDENTYLWRGSRICKACRVDYSRERKRRIRAAKVTEAGTR